MNGTALVAFLVPFNVCPKDLTPVLSIGKGPEPMHPPTAPTVHSFALAAAILCHISEVFQNPSLWGILYREKV